MSADWPLDSFSVDSRGVTDPRELFVLYIAGAYKMFNQRLIEVVKNEYFSFGTNERVE